MNQRLARQYLESLQRAGITHLPLVQPIALPAVEPQATVQQEPAAPVQPQPAPPSVTTQAPPAPSPLQAQTPRQPAPVTSSAPVTPAAQPEPAAAPTTPLPVSTGGAADRATALAKVAQRVAACVKCQELASSRTQTVFGVGNPCADLMFIGEAPGADEDRLGEPFVGKAGQLLNKIIEACKLKREDIYICNILRCRPPGNRNPSPVEASNCREFLDAQIATVQPKYIICWGSVAAHNLLSETTSVGRMRGKFYSYGTAKVACTYHPSYLLRNPAAKKMVWEDMKFVFADMGVQL